MHIENDFNDALIYQEEYSDSVIERNSRTTYPVTVQPASNHSKPGTLRSSTNPFEMRAQGGESAFAMPAPGQDNARPVFAMPPPSESTALKTSEQAIYNAGLI